jgi:hypothetical protein
MFKAAHDAYWNSTGNIKKSLREAIEAALKVMDEEPDEEGWIENTGVMPDAERVDVKFENGWLFLDVNPELYVWDGDQNYYDPIAYYRIVEEKKSQHDSLKCEYCKWDVIYGRINQSSSCPIVKELHNKKQPKKYKLSEMWKGLGVHKGVCYNTALYTTKKECKNRNSDILAITRADATEFYLGEGLDD